jgi:dolichyl-phosphate-mannose--protein O-mannosyl transferase
MSCIENGMITESRYTSPEIFALAFAATATCSWTLMQRHLKNK